MTDQFTNIASGVDGPATDAFAITPNDSADLVQVTRGLFVGAGGDVVIVTRAGTTATFTNIQGGAVLPLRVRRILATGTTASGIIGLI